MTTRPAARTLSIALAAAIGVAGIGLSSPSAAASSRSPVAASTARPGTVAAAPQRATAAKQQHTTYVPNSKPLSSHLRPAASKGAAFDVGDRLIPAWRAGKISRDTLVRLGMLSILHPSEVPPQLRPRRPLGELAPVYYGFLLAQLNRSSASTKRWFATSGTAAGAARTARTAASMPPAAADPPPPPYVNECSDPVTIVFHDFQCLHLTEHFSIRYSIPQTSPGGPTVPGIHETDADGNGYPDTLDAMVEGLESAYRTYVGMGYKPPTPDGGRILVLVGIDDLGNPGLTLQSIGPAGGGAPAVLLPSDPDASQEANYLVRHELFHVFQYSYLNFSRLIGCDLPIACPTNELPSLNWWMEATAEWATHQSFLDDSSAATTYDPEQTFYARALPWFLQSPTKAVNRWDGLGGHVQYGAFLLAQDLAEYTGREAIRHTWENLQDGLPMQAIDKTLSNYGWAPDSFYAYFAMDNYLGDGAYLDHDAAYAGPDRAGVWRTALQKGADLQRPDGQPLTALDDLGPARPARDREMLHIGGTTTGTADLEPGGTAYIDLVLPSEPVTRNHSLDVRIGGPQTVQAWLLLWSDQGYPSVSSRLGPLTPSASTGGETPHISTTLPAGTRFATLVITRLDRVTLSQDAAGATATASWSVDYGPFLRSGAWSWGHNSYGEWGTGAAPSSEATQWYPQPITALSDVAQVAAGFHTGYAVTSGGALWSWGANDEGALGDGTTTDRASPVRVKGLEGVVAVWPGYNDAFAKLSDGTVWGWGENSQGGLGVGWRRDSYLPVTEPIQVPLADVVDLSAGAQETFAVTSDGSVWAWGFDWYNNLGDGGDTNRLLPVRIPGISDVTEISVGATGGVLARKRDGTVWVWGLNDWGELGLGSFSRPEAPVQNPSLTGIEHVVSGYRDAYAVTASGQVLGWGENAGGQLGPGPVSQLVPMAIPGFTGVTQVASGDRSVLALTTDGRVLGAGNAQQLGAGPAGSSSTPVQTGYIAGVRQVAACDDVAFALLGPPP